MQKAKLTSTALWDTRSRKAIAGPHDARSFVRRGQKTPEVARIVRDARDFGFEMRVAATNAVGPSVARAALGQRARKAVQGARLFTLLNATHAPLLLEIRGQTRANRR